MFETTHKTLTALIKSIKNDIENNVTQIAVVIEKDEKGKSVYKYARPLINRNTEH